ncbi:MAG TPA: hypothetical protein DCM45_04170 [Clostridiales bacterium]|nr:hypothetical protein [Clostridiales bacterium]
MQSRHSAAGKPGVRPIEKSLSAAGLRPALRHHRALLAIMLVLAISLAGATGYLIGNINTAQAAAVVNDTECVAAFSNKIATDNDLCSLVEQVNLQDQLNAEIQKNASLEDSLDAQQQEMDSLEVTILGALMANLDSKLVSRSGPTANAYRDEAKNLVELKYKLNKFKKTDKASEIDLTTYEAAIKKRLDYLPTIKPIPGYYDGYGNRRHPIYGYYHFHPGADVGAARGTQIKAAASGTVIASTYGGGSGYYVTIDHRNGFTTTYMHCSKLLVSAGEKVTKGEVIALVGNTGSSTTPHLHYEIRFYGEPLNPTRMIME